MGVKVARYRMREKRVANLNPSVLLELYDLAEDSQTR